MYINGNLGALTKKSCCVNCEDSQLGIIPGAVAAAPSLISAVSSLFGKKNKEKCIDGGGNMNSQHGCVSCASDGKRYTPNGYAAFCKDATAPALTPNVAATSVPQASVLPNTPAALTPQGTMPASSYAPQSDLQKYLPYGIAAAVGLLGLVVFANKRRRR